MIAKALDEFFRDNNSLLVGRTDGQYLKNRLEKAFIEGWDAAKRSIVLNVKDLLKKQERFVKNRAFKCSIISK